MYEYKAKVVKIVDGDTIDFSLALGFHMTTEIRTRLKGIDTPEMRGEERYDGLISKEFVVETLGSAKEIMVRTHKTGKYGRWLADILFKPLVEDPNMPEKVIDGDYINLNQLLLVKGLAKKY